MTSSLGLRDFKKYLGIAGEKIGIGHRRPDMGTFRVETVSKVEGN